MGVDGGCGCCWCGSAVTGAICTLCTAIGAAAAGAAVCMLKEASESKAAEMGSRVGVGVEVLADGADGCKVEGVTDEGLRLMICGS